MTNNEKYFLKLVCSAVNNKTAPLPKNIDWDEVYRLCLLHETRAMVFPFIKDICEDKKLVEEWETAFINISCIMANVEHETDIIIGKFVENKIAHTLFKGYILREYYPYKDMRTMGDVDILVDTGDLDAVYQIMADVGFRRTKISAYVQSYQKDDFVFEIHTKVIYKPIYKRWNFLDYFNKAGEHTILYSDKNKYTHIFEPEFHLIYLITHLVKHFYSNGFGVRMLMDLVVFIKHHELNWTYIWEELEKLHLRTFACYIFYLCNAWFSSSVQGIEAMQPQKYELLANNILSGGIFSSDYDGDNSEKKSRFTKIRRFFSVIFPSLEYMSYNHNYINVKKYPFLLPAAWIHRIYHVLFINKKGIMQSIDLTKTVAVIKGTQEKQMELAEKLGLENRRNNY